MIYQSRIIIHTLSSVPTPWNDLERARSSPSVNCRNFCFSFSGTKWVCNKSLRINVFLVMGINFLVTLNSSASPVSLWATLQNLMFQFLVWLIHALDIKSLFSLKCFNIEWKWLFTFMINSSSKIKTKITYWHTPRKCNYFRRETSQEYLTFWKLSKNILLLRGSSWIQML